MNHSATALHHRINKPQWSHAVILVVIRLTLANESMLAFEVLVNGKPACTAGATEGHRVLVTSLNWTSPDHFILTVGGVPESNHHFQYSVPEVGMGDEITIRIIETDNVDQPDTIRPVPEFQDDD